MHFFYIFLALFTFIWEEPFGEKMMKFFDESILIRLRHSLKQLKFGISSIFCLYSFYFEITYNAAKIKQICNWRVVVSGLLFFVQLFIKSFDYTVILITEICLVNYFYISTFCHFVWCCEAWVLPTVFVTFLVSFLLNLNWMKKISNMTSQHLYSIHYNQRLVIDAN